MIVCVPVMADGEVDPRWGRAARVAIATIDGGRVARWEERQVGWDTLHDAGTEGGHHARVAAFLRDNGVDVVVANHMGDGMRQMLASMGLEVTLGADGSARDAVAAVTGIAEPRRAETGE